MKSRLEILPNELFFSIFSYLSWNEILVSFWSLNERFNSLVCSTFSTNQTRIVINPTGLSYTTFSSKLFQLISNCSSLISSIRCMHLDGTNSNSCDFFNHNRTILHYRNLKSLILTQCYLSESLIENLSWLIEYQLNALTLILDEDIFTAFKIREQRWNIMSSDVTKCIFKFRDLLRQLFSPKCQLISLRLSIHNDESLIYIYESLSCSYGCCLSLRYLHVHLNYGGLLQDILVRVPNLERLSVDLWLPWIGNEFFDSFTGKPKTSIGTCYNKKLNLQKLKSFTLKSEIQDDVQLNYLKWIFNNLNHVEKLTICLQICKILKDDPVTNRSAVIDANFIRKYLMGDIIINLIHFDFFIISKCELMLNNTERIINSFKIHPFFIEHQWTNVTCVHDLTNSYQYLSSSVLTINTSQYSQDYLCNSTVFDWPRIKCLTLNFYRNVYSLFERLDQLFPNVSCIKFHMMHYPIIDDSDDSTASFEMIQHKLINNRLQYVTRLDFGLFFVRTLGSYSWHGCDCERRLKLLALLISMPNQLNYLRIAQFQSLLEITKYASDQLRKDALSTVRYLEFCLPSCNYGTNEATGLGKSLVPFLNEYIPHLQTLRLWSRDDFPWTTLRPYYNPIYYANRVITWEKYLETLRSINKHVTVFQEDLSQLFEHLKCLVYLDIHGKIDQQKVESYQLMIQRRFPNTYCSIEKTRFRLWT